MTDFNKNFKKFLLTENEGVETPKDDLTVKESDATEEANDEFSEQEMFDRMESLANTSELKELQDMMRIVATEWWDEGFEKEDIKAYMSNFIDNI